jgi:hypothetical protein
VAGGDGGGPCCAARCNEERNHMPKSTAAHIGCRKRLRKPVNMDGGACHAAPGCKPGPTGCRNYNPGVNIDSGCQYSTREWRMEGAGSSCHSGRLQTGGQVESPLKPEVSVLKQYLSSKPGQDNYLSCCWEVVASQL